jgi:hypothetical protein
MSQIEHVVKVFLNVHEVVAFVWVRVQGNDPCTKSVLCAACSDSRQGPIKLGLVLASARLESLGYVLDTYVEIGEIIPGLQQYDSVFQSCPAVTEVLERYFGDILQLHANVLDVFARPGN